MGFESPQELWIKDIKQEMLECVQRSRILKEIFCFSFLSSLSSSGGGGGILWLLFAIAKWEEIYKVGLE
ncbi:hypothetical protein CCZ01_09805 [Helicobacter monodelphidis]|uniref:hypothetical protein n=1 Tax=Helicobacter sp. 15-1451 TaxID=2004995 RepID=UPI000DCAFCAA|nr:hypothetical protein [Helicobacter sp. 15-1451]RAX56084.1 hypothetical protein CCZ01_09805 [Helicobacter sp. 15-1451]